MIWFGGSIPEAINAAKQQSRIFVVVITGRTVFFVCPFRRESALAALACSGEAHQVSSRDVGSALPLKSSLPAACQRFYLLPAAFRRLLAVNKTVW